MPTAKLSGQPPAKPSQAVRGGGGICPAKAHAHYFDIDLAEAQDLARVSEKKARVLTKIPEHFRLEATGARVNSDAFKDLVMVRAMIGTESATTARDNGEKSSSSKPSFIELEKRSNPEWNGLHVRVLNGDNVRVKVQGRTEAQGPWKEILQVTVDPLRAFTVQDQDLVWYPTNTKVGDRDVTVWVELSLVRMTSQILEIQKGTNIVSKQRSKIQQFKFEPKR